MSGRKISDFFTPTTASRTKRSRSSPEVGGTPERRPRHCAMENEKVGEMTVGQLMASLNRLWDEKLTALATKDELNLVSSAVEDLKEDNKKQREIIHNLKAQNDTIIAKLNDLESRSRRNNLIFKGLKLQGNKVDCREVIHRFLSEVLGCDNKPWINRAHFIGEGQAKAIIAHFPDDRDIDNIMRQTRKLRGTGYVIHRDYTREVRTKRSYLMAVRAELERMTGRRRIPLIFDHLMVDNLRLTWEAGKLMAGREDGGVALQRLLGVDFTPFINNLAANGLPRRHFVAEDDDRGETGGEDRRRGPGTDTRDYSTVTATNPTQA